jgi:hypothetical protein
MNQILISPGIITLWALTSLLSRETQPLPPRPGRPRPDDGLRPSPALARNDQGAANLARGNSDRGNGAALQNQLSSRAANPPPLPRSPSGLRTLSNDDVRILDSEPRPTRSLSGSSILTSPSAAPARGSRSPSKRGSRTRSTPSPAAAKSADPARGRALSSQINQSMAQAANRPLEITPLEIPLASLSSSHIPLGARLSSEPASFRAVRPALDGKTLGAMFSSPEKLREIAVLTEVLKPPLALRQKRR